MIYITEDQAAHVKYLLEQAIQGNHILFDSPTLKRILEIPITPGDSDSYAIEPHIEKIMSLKGLAEKRAYLERLDPKTFVPGYPDFPLFPQRILQETYNFVRRPYPSLN